MSVALGESTPVFPNAVCVVPGQAVRLNDSRSRVVHGRLCDFGPVEKAQALMPRWRVDILRKRAEHLGTVEAATQKEAFEKAAERFEMPPERSNRIAVQKMGMEKD
jgi:hypothetical protein